MLQTVLANGKQVSVVGIGGHYRHFERGRFEETCAPVDAREVESRARLVQRAVDSGITYFDTTWFNEVEMLSRTLERTGLRDRVFVNGMVLGAFTGPAGFGLKDRDYFNRYLDKRLAALTGNRFDSFMINAVEEGYDRARCEGLLKLLLERKAAGDIGMIGFSAHDHRLAREIADEFPAFEIIMTAFNFRNRQFERCFCDYQGGASFVAMKPMVWAEYGLPFTAINLLDDFAGEFGFEKDGDAAARALRYPRTMPKVNVTLCSVNSPAELDSLIAAGEGAFTPADAKVLSKYDSAIELDRGVPLFLGGLRMDNLRANHFAARNLCGVLGIDAAALDAEGADARQAVEECAARIREALRHTPYRRYLPREE